MLFSYSHNLIFESYFFKIKYFLGILSMNLHSKLYPTFVWKSRLTNSLIKKLIEVWIMSGFLSVS